MASRLNCVANGRVLREGPFEELWIQPAAGDAGGGSGGRAVHLASIARPAAPLSLPIASRDHCWAPATRMHADRGNARYTGCQLSHLHRRARAVRDRVRSDRR
ncbi:MAG: carbamoyltransferase N-terminal domain-containing protein [Pirellulaceae bacterium]